MGVMLKGKMKVLTDQETKDLIWRKGDKMFYKGELLILIIVY